jgi:hypothetical protein
LSRARYRKSCTDITPTLAGSAAVAAVVVVAAAAAAVELVVAVVVVVVIVARIERTIRLAFVTL